MSSTTKRGGSLRRRAFSTFENLFGFRNWWKRSKNCSVEISHWVPERPDTLDLDLDNISGLHEDLRVSHEAHTSRRARGDNIPDFERHDLGNVGNQIRHFENQISRVGLLHGLAVEPQLNRQSVAVSESALRHEVRSHRCERVE